MIANSHLLLDMHHTRAADLHADAAHARLVRELKRHPSTDTDRVPRPARAVRWWQRQRAALS